MNRLDRLEEKQAHLEDKLDQKKKKKKKLRFLGKIMRMGKKVDKDLERVLVQYLTSDYQMLFKDCKIIGGNLIVVNNKVHVLNPKRVWKYKKLTFYIVREIDRQPVSNDDYDAVKARKDDTEADVPLIKAVLGAVQKPNPLQGKGTWIAIGIAVIVMIVVVSTFMGG